VAILVDQDVGLDNITLDMHKHLTEDYAPLSDLHGQGEGHAYMPDPLRHQQAEHVS